MRQKIHRIIGRMGVWEISVLLFALFAWLWTLRYAYVWRWVESMTLFVPDGPFLQTFLRNPGGLPAYAGSFLTQFLHLPALGCALWVALALLLSWMTRRLFRLEGGWSPLAFLPAFFLLAANLDLGYTWATLKAPGHFFAPTLGTLAALGGLAAFRRFCGRFGRLVTLLSLVALYPLFGFYALFSAGLCLLDEAREGNGWFRYALPLVGIAAIYLLPKLYFYGFGATEQELSRLYVAGLPTFYIRRLELGIWLPFLALILFYLILSLLPNERSAAGKAASVGAWAAFAVGLAFALGQTYDNPNFEASVRSALAIDEEDWREAAEAVRDVRGPNRIVVINGQMAVAYQGLPVPRTAVPDIPPAYKDSRPGLLTFMQMSGLYMNLYSGQINQAYRWAMELSVEYGFRPCYLKLLVKSALLNGEPELARKYNDRLRRTLFHRDWAERYQRYIDRPELVASDKLFSRIPKDPLPNRFVE